MDIRLRGISGIEATQLIKKNCPEIKIIGLSFHIETDYADKMMQCGAKGYLSKNSSPDEIFKAITEVNSGRTYICREDMQTCVFKFLPLLYMPRYIWPV